MKFCLCTRLFPFFRKKLFYLAMQLLIFQNLQRQLKLFRLAQIYIDHMIASQSYAPIFAIRIPDNSQVLSAGCVHPCYPFGWWAQMDFWLFGASHQVATPFNPQPCRALVGSNGLGPSTSRLSGVCSNQLSYEPIFGGGNRVRTDDPLLAGQVLYQLSYTPISP